MRIGPVLVDGVPSEDAAIPVDDIAVQRGYGCFETIRSYGGAPFRLDRHLARLRSSAARLGMTLPEEDDLTAWVEERAAEGDCTVRLIVTGGTDLDHPGTGSRTLVFAETLASLPTGLRLLPVVAPWHPDGAWSGLTGAKTLSYAPNMEARLAALRSGFDGPRCSSGAAARCSRGPTRASPGCGATGSSTRTARSVCSTRSPWGP